VSVAVKSSAKQIYVYFLGVSDILPPDISPSPTTSYNASILTTVMQTSVRDKFLQQEYLWLLLSVKVKVNEFVYT